LEIEEIDYIFDITKSPVGANQATHY